MKIGIINNITTNGKEQIKKFFEGKNFKYINGDIIIDTVDYNEATNKINKIISDNKNYNYVLDLSNLYDYNNLLNNFDFIIEIKDSKINTIGINRIDPFIINNNPNLKIPHNIINIQNKNWEENLNDFFEFNTNNKTLVSIIVPVYNTEKYLRKCINSIINQSYKNIEILIINDGSTDNSEHIINKFAVLDKRIKVFKKANGGLSETRNFGLDNSKGKYILFIDSDDYIENNMVELMLKKITKEKTDVCECGFFIHNKDNTITDYSSIMKINSPISNVDRLLEAYANGEILIATWNKMYLKDKIKNIKFDSTCFKEDSDYTLRLCECGLSFTQLKLPLYHYVKKESNSLTGNAFSDRFFQLERWSENKAYELRKKNTKYNDIANKILFNCYVHILKYYLRDFNKGIIDKSYEYHIKEIYNKLIKLIINTKDVTIYRFFDNVIDLLNIYIDKKIIDENDIYKQNIKCIGIIWNSLNKTQSKKITNYLSRNGKINQITKIDLKDKFKKFIEDIYIENKEVKGVSFIKYATLYNQFKSNEITIINLDIPVSLYEYTNNLKGYQFENLAKIKGNIRNKYSNKIKNYAFDNIFHMTMNDDEYTLTNNILKKYIKNYQGENYE